MAEAAPRPARDPVSYRNLVLWGVALALTVLGGGQVWLAWKEILRGGMDIQQDYIAAQRVLKKQDIYAPFSPEEITALGVQEDLGFGMRRNVHPPLTALLFVPLAMLSFPVATLLWTLLSVALLMGTLLALTRELRLPVVGPWRLLVPMLLLSWYPMWIHLHLGQLTLLLTGLVVGAWLCLRRGRDGAAGVLLAVAALLKMFPALLLAIAVLQRRRRWRMLAFAVGAAVGALLAHGFAFPGQWSSYLAEVVPRAASEWSGCPRNASLLSIGSRLFLGSKDAKAFVDLPGAALPLDLALGMAAAAIGALVLWRRRAALDLDGTYALLVSAIVLLSPLSWEHAYLLLLFPLAVTWRRFLDGRSGRLPVVLAVATLALAMWPAEVVLLKIKGHYWPGRMPGWVGLIAPGVAVTTSCYAMVLALIWRDRRPVAAPPRP